MSTPEKRVLVGMSGGIDSTATCLMLKEQGYEIVGLTMWVWGDEPVEARQLADSMGIEHHVADEREAFRQIIVQNFIDEYCQGRTPNPCVMCNPLFKFRILEEWADKLGCAYIATGHYTRLEERNGKVYIIAGDDDKKDQSYFLWRLGQELLKRCIFPLGTYTKQQVREYLRDKGYTVKAEEGESMEVCFIKGDYRDFLREHSPEIDREVGPGWFVNSEGVKLGEHKGFPYYTIGQRKGLEIALGKPAYVLKINPQKNTVMLGDAEQLKTGYMLAEHENLVDEGEFFESKDAGSIAKYNALKTPNIVTSGGEVGIPSDMANGYYQKSLSASKEIIEEGGYELYNKEEDKGINFYKMLMDKTGNKEVIWVKDYQNPLKVHSFGYDNVIHHLREDNDNSSCIGPSLGLVEAFDYLDGISGTLHYKNGNDYIVYKNPSDIFANKDARLYGTIIYPGTKFRGQDVDIQAGVAVWNDINGSYDLLTDPSLGSFYTDNKTFVGQDGPQTNTPNVSNTGFYIRKFISEASGYTLRNYAENWWPWFRLGEIYLNATEAAFELNDETNALHYINKLRERAGFPANSLNKLTIEKIQNERRVELAFEDHRYFDMKRWRIADAVWNGNEDNDQAIVYGLYPYRIAKAKPGTQDQDKYIFVKTRSERFKVARTFQQSNYYSFIEDAVINNNPTIVKNPFQ